MLRVDIEGGAYHGLAGIQTVESLMKVVSVGRIVHILGYLVDTGERMENAHILFGAYQHGTIECVKILDTFIFH